MDKPPDSPHTSDEADQRSAGEDAFAHLTPLVHQQLRRLGQRYLQREGKGNTGQPDILANDASPNRITRPGIMTRRAIGDRLIDQKHFFTVCARQMRRILVDHAQARGSANGLPATGNNFDVLELDQLLRQLEPLEPNAALAFELYYFGGHDDKELATLTKVSVVTVQRRLRFARAWLLSQMQRSVS